MQALFERGVDRAARYGATITDTMLFGDSLAAAVVASLGSGHRPVALDKARIERQIRELALEHAAGRLDDGVYVERLHEFRAAKENIERTSAGGISPERAVEWLRAVSATWRAAEVPSEKADLLHAIYDRIIVAGRRIVSFSSLRRRTPSDSRSRYPGCSGAPDRCWTRDFNLHHPDRGPR